MTLAQLILAMGIPSAIFSALLGLLVWWFKRKIDERDRKIEEREALKQASSEEQQRNYEKIMLMIMQTGRASYVLAEATARAVQRIPDAKCNGDMTKALEQAQKMQKEEQDFLVKQGVKHLFGNESEVA